MLSFYDNLRISIAYVFFKCFKTNKMFFMVWEAQKKTLIELVSFSEHLDIVHYSNHAMFKQNGPHISSFSPEFRPFVNLKQCNELTSHSCISIRPVFLLSKYCLCFLVCSFSFLSKGSL